MDQIGSHGCIDQKMLGIQKSSQFLPQLVKWSCAKFVDCFLEKLRYNNITSCDKSCELFFFKQNLGTVS